MHAIMQLQYFEIKSVSFKTINNVIVVHSVNRVMLSSLQMWMAFWTILTVRYSWVYSNLVFVSCKMSTKL